MTQQTVHEYAAALRHRYRAARKGAKWEILDEFCQTTGMHRKAAIRLLGKRTRPRLVGRGRPRRYGPEVTQALVKLWEVGDRMCGKLLASVVPDLLAAPERHGELLVVPDIRALLLQVSPSTIDRLLRRHGTGGLRQRKRQRPAITSLKSQVPIRTWGEWRGVKPGSLQADLVLRCGESVEGFFLTTLCAVAIAHTTRCASGRVKRGRRPARHRPVHWGCPLPERDQIAEVLPLALAFRRHRSL